MPKENIIEKIENSNNYKSIMELLKVKGYTQTHYWSSGWRATYREHGYSSRDGSTFVRFDSNNHETKIYLYIYHHGKKAAKKIIE